MSDEEKNMKNDLFLKIQHAYETLHDTERRLQYDLKLTGVQYDILKDDNNEIDLYMRKPFNLFVKSSQAKMRFKLHFFATFTKPKVSVKVKVRFRVFFYF
jgi:DnaJ-class molecular chaperone